MGDYGRVAGVMGQIDGRKGFAQGANLIHLNQNSVGRMLFNAPP